MFFVIMKYEFVDISFCLIQNDALREVLDFDHCILTFFTIPDVMI